MKDMGAIVLEDEMVLLGEDIQLIGCLDPRHHGEPCEALFDRVKPDLRKPVLVLTHRPRHFGKLEELGCDLVMAGHTHGFNIPQFMGGNILGDMYSEGIGTRVSMQTAFNLYTRCMTEMYHNQDVPPYLASLLLYRLGMCFKNGDGTEKNLHIAYESLMTAKTKIFLGSMDNRDVLLSDISKALAEIETELNSERKRPE